MNHFIFIGIHIVAVATFPWGLFISIPWHITYQLELDKARLKEYEANWKEFDDIRYEEMGACIKNGGKPTERFKIAYAKWDEFKKIHHGKPLNKEDEERLEKEETFKEKTKLSRFFLFCAYIGLLVNIFEPLFTDIDILDSSNLHDILFVILIIIGLSFYRYTEKLILYKT